VREYTDKIKLDPNNAGVYITRGNAYREKGNYDRAIADYNRGLSLGIQRGIITQSRVFMFPVIPVNVRC